MFKLNLFMIFFVSYIPILYPTFSLHVSSICKKILNKMQSPCSPEMTLLFQDVFFFMFVFFFLPLYLFIYLFITHVLANSSFRDVYLSKCDTWLNQDWSDTREMSGEQPEPGKCHGVKVAGSAVVLVMYIWIERHTHKPCAPHIYSCYRTLHWTGRD